MEKRTLNIAALATIYFSELNEATPSKYAPKSRSSADKNFRKKLNGNKIDPNVFNKAKLQYIETIIKEMEALLS